MSESRYFKSEDGSVMVEMASSVGLFLFVLILGLSMSLETYKLLSLHDALAKASRQASLIAEVDVKRIARIKDISQHYFTMYGLKVPPGSLRVCRAEDLACQQGNGPESASGAEEFFHLSVLYTVSLPFGFKFTHRFSSMTRNEPFQ